jgi:hypothetical protein
MLAAFTDSTLLSAFIKVSILSTPNELLPSNINFEPLKCSFIAFSASLIALLKPISSIF